MKSVSVAMATYNGEKYLKKQIDSILNQLSEDDELVISYDESEDSTLEIIKEYEKRNKNVKVVYNPKRGLFSNFENAIRNCTREYIFISDQDDIWIEDKKEIVLRDFECEDVDMVIHNGYHIDEKDVKISEDFFTTYSINGNWVKNFLKPRYSGCCMAFTDKMKKRILPIPRKVGAYDHWIGMVGESFGKVYYEKKPLLMHRLHGDNVTVSTRSIGVILGARWNILIELMKRKQI